MVGRFVGRKPEGDSGRGRIDPCQYASPLARCLQELLSRMGMRSTGYAIRICTAKAHLASMFQFPFEAFRLARFGDDPSCPRCGSRRVAPWGGYNGRRRYRCAGCLRTFSDFTGTPFAYLKRIDCWPRYLACLKSGSSVRVAASIAGIHRDTAFRWRHRFLSAARRFVAARAYDESTAECRTDAVAVPFEGRIHIGERWLPESFKGLRTLPRPPRRSGYRGPSFQTTVAWIMVAIGERGGMTVRHVGPSRPVAEDLTRSLAPLLPGRRALVGLEGRFGAAARMATQCGHRYRQIRFQRANPSNYVHMYWLGLRAWNERFRGVSTRYLRNYLFWHQWVAAPPRWRIDPPPWLVGATIPADRGRGELRLPAPSAVRGSGLRRVR